MIDEKRLIKECEERLLVGTSVIKLIEEQPKICEWIPLEEKTPENGEHVLLSFANEKQEPLVGTWKVDDEGGAFYAPFTGRTYASLGCFVTAWMPLPEPVSYTHLNKVVSTLEMPHEEWLRYRKKGIGGSDAGAICGVNKYRSAVSVFLDKTTEQTSEFDNEAMRQGRDLEQYVAERFCEETGKKVRRANAIFSHSELPFMLANVDRLVVGENAGLECKTASAFSADKWADGSIPPEYEVQCNHYMACLLYTSCCGII